MRRVLTPLLPIAIGLTAALAALTGLCQVLPELSAPQPVPWRQETGWFLVGCSLVLGVLAFRDQPVRVGVAFLRQLAVGLLAVYVVTVLSVGGEAWARYVFRALIGGWITLFLIWKRYQHPEPGLVQKLMRGLDVASANAALIVVLGELGLRGYAAWSGQSMLVRQGMAACRLQPNRDYGGLLFTNSRGFCSREFETAKKQGVRRIAVLGDSFAVGTVRQDRNFVSLLETLVPNTEVYNFGVSGTGPREYLEILQTEVWPYSPDLVLVSFFVGNDITGWIPLPNARRMHPECHSLYLFAQRAWRLGREWWQRRADDAYAGERILHPFRFGVRSRANHLYLEFEGLKICRPSCHALMEKNWQRSLGYMDRIVAECRRRGVPVLIALHPDEFQVNPVLLAEVMDEYQIPPSDIDLSLPQERLMRFFDERRVPCLDLKTALEGTPDTFRPRDAHYNEKGNHLVAVSLAAWLTSELRQRLMLK